MSPPRGAGQRLLVVDDDPRLAELLETTLSLAGYEVEVVGSGAEALHACASTRPDLMVLDVMLPDMDGFAVCQRLIENEARLPVLFLTARDAVEDRVTGLALGADDYLTKPFSVLELLARVHVLLRRAGTAAGSSHVLRFADLTVDERSMRVRRGDRLITLSPTEYKLLRYLLVNSERVVSKDQIMDHVWQHRFSPGVVEKLVSRLRAKVDAQPPALLRTVRGFGYSLRSPGSD
ncbi:two-component system, OmpR family, response regulator [Saccharopolyspora antimicrobica]|uniref:Two-component system OmpR family response regulator n=1 Tax=Saccharopolyspora antimicrobica TaxID=455193 RepID=A0A1I5GQP2_9PSEU|nr:response regulator transcription factor [Saccharopolyspora antimicrobica]RKT87399.1 two-component system OmpR family response regulator [Saccharopolyspora antimicrobica]SFO38384.1 two-component system, OmpR family, response regulator [Saccharopolyspora antimicrobica]